MYDSGHICAAAPHIIQSCVLNLTFAPTEAPPTAMRTNTLLCIVAVQWCCAHWHEATESIMQPDPVQGLLLGEGIQVDQEHVFEDGEGALINPYQKYRMVLSHDGSMAPRSMRVASGMPCWRASFLSQMSLQQNGGKCGQPRKVLLLV